ncbi:hypothetical protein Pmani_037925 [Petrolisthes manimaculis]|uniref:Uncharacterized protein n=1 Tax=Petrolisthes manimaculis TaxID=1843537 RepID=A0AAE1NGR2_9EUCA|nr:hypothetical protein Pmani_037925 [Petrolisthes manimaculis]
MEGWREDDKGGGERVDDGYTKKWKGMKGCGRGWRREKGERWRDGEGGGGEGGRVEVKVEKEVRVEERKGEVNNREL